MAQVSRSRVLIVEGAGGGRSETHDRLAAAGAEIVCYEADETDLSARSVDPERFAAVVFVGTPAAVATAGPERPLEAIVRAFYQTGRVIGALGPAVALLTRAGIARGLTIAAGGRVASDLVGAGAVLSEAAVAVDRGIVTARDAADEPMFIAKLMTEIQVGLHQR
ncbi:DJ-1/PfpI family protein [Segnochrobactrum spirostomi]|uniref:DJ-1/PfpI domain-containing protein n=1 Tax=Segnochrobactrum spirostomi TaxID=2608987 RepID=A0A6A7XY85_9HYPH|nr:DJ-1/PfpI family protein [Segnochrobactrum spirostomi]MQT11650.1 hypothetical protein [Segnochrobactrum spirostomi]